MPFKQTNKAFRIIALPGEEPEPSTKAVAQPQPTTKTVKRKTTRTVAIRLSAEEKEEMRLKEKAEKEARKAQQAQERLARLQKRANKDNTVTVVAIPATEDKPTAERGNLVDITNSTVISGARANDAQSTAGASTSKDKKTSNGKKRKQTTDDASDEVAESSKKTKTSEVTATDAADASTGATAPVDATALAANEANITNNNTAPSGGQSANATATNAPVVQASCSTEPVQANSEPILAQAAFPPRAISRAARAALMVHAPFHVRRVQQKLRRN